MTWRNPATRQQPRGPRSAERGTGPREYRDHRGDPDAVCPHCASSVISCHHSMFRCADTACGRWWHLKEIIPVEDWTAGENTPAPIVRADPLDDHVESVDSSCAECGQRRCVCADPPASDFREPF